MEEWKKPLGFNRSGVSRKPWFVTGYRRKEAIGIPGIPGSLRRAISKTWLFQLCGQLKDIFRRGSTPMHHHHRGLRSIQ
jgi:hypothetical protein